MTGKSMKIGSQDVKIHKFLSSSTFFIPRFQRAYSWEVYHISTFWDDIIANMSKSYFIGSMVVYDYEKDRSQDTNVGETLAIVDGQQRLTTITILLCAIREGFKRLQRTDLANGLKKYIHREDHESKTVYVLQTETSFPYLEEKILKNSKADVDPKIGTEEKNLSKAYQMFIKNIKCKIEDHLGDKRNSEKVNNENATQWLSDLRDTVLQLNVIQITLDNENDAYLIFETLNTRGKDLALMDLIRNHLAKFLVPTSKVDQVKIKLGKVLDIIEDAPSRPHLDPDTFLVHSWQSRYDFVTKANTFPKMKERIERDNAQNHLDQILSDADYWRSIFDTDHLWGNQEKIAVRSLDALRIFKVVQPAPGLLSLIRAYRDKTISYKQLYKTLDQIEKFHFAFNAITGSRSNGGISGMYAKFGRKIFAANDTNKAGIEIKALCQKLKDRIFPDAEFDAGFEQVTYSTKKQLVRYILEKVAIYEEQPYIGDPIKISIEHLKPQAKGGNKDSINGQIGNLMLVDADTNSKYLAANNFKTKKKILLDKGYKLPKIFMEADELTNEMIQANTQRISELARTKIWNL